MEALTIVFVAALAVEGIWEALKHPFGDAIDWLDDNTPLYWDKLGTLVLGVLVAVFAQIDLLALVGIELEIAVVGMILTGALIGRGSNFVHDLIDSIQAVKGKKEVENVVETKKLLEEEGEKNKG